MHMCTYTYTQTASRPSSQPNSADNTDESHPPFWIPLYPFWKKQCVSVRVLAFRIKTKAISQAGMATGD